MELSDAFQLKKGAHQHYYRVIHPRVVQKGKTKVFNVNLHKEVFISNKSFLLLEQFTRNQQRMVGFLREANDWREQQHMQKLCICSTPLPADLKSQIWSFVYDNKNTFEHAVFSFYREQWKAQFSSHPLIISYPEHVRLLLLALEFPQDWTLSHARSDCGPFVYIEDTQQPSAQLFITLSAKLQHVRFDVQDVLDKRYVLVDSLMIFNLHFSFHVENNRNLTPPDCVTAFLQKQFDQVV